MHKVLIITYYWPPSGGSAVLRWLKFAKYLREFGWEPVIYTPQNPEPQEIDNSLLKDVPPGLTVIQSRIWEPYTLYKRLSGKKKEDRLGVALMSTHKKPGRFSKLSLWIRSNLFIPDPRRCWVRPSIRLLTGYLKLNKVDVVITTGPPHSMHLIGMGLKRRTGIPWVADFRDPWTDIDFYRDLLLTRWADRRHKKLEKKVLESADHVIAVSPGMTKAFKAMGIRHVSTITNGYDTEPAGHGVPGSGKFTLLHLGSLPSSRNPAILWEALSMLVKENADFASNLEIRLIGKADRVVRETVEKYELGAYVVWQDFVPHDETPGIMTRASVLLLCINNTPNAGGILTNKFFEYLSANRPIVALGPADGDASAILAETKAGKIFEYGDTEGLKSHLFALFVLYSQHNLHVENQQIGKYARKNLTGLLSELLNKLL
jgi:glycosyltransferase involved in cell wall biosynthesis